MRASTGRRAIVLGGASAVFVAVVAAYAVDRHTGNITLLFFGLPVTIMTAVQALRARSKATTAAE
jgi:hypothetical protein